MIRFFLALALSIYTISCSWSQESTGDFTFYISEVDLAVKTSKDGSDFYVYFAKTKNSDSLNARRDYVRCKVHDAVLAIVFDINKPDSIFFTYPYVTEIRRQNVDFVRVDEGKFYDRFYLKGIKANPDTLRQPYQVIFIAPKSYRIIHQRNSSVGSQVVIKDSY